MSQENPPLSNRNLVAVSELQYLLVKLAGEASELAQATLKALEFGIDAPCPKTGLLVRDRIESEYNDVLGSIKMLNELGFVIETKDELIDARVNKVGMMMDIARSYGVLEHGVVNTAERKEEVIRYWHVLGLDKIFEFKDQAQFDDLISVIAEFPQVLPTIRHNVRLLEENFVDIHGAHQSLMVSRCDGLSILHRFHVPVPPVVLSCISNQLVELLIKQDPTTMSNMVHLMVDFPAGE